MIPFECPSCKSQMLIDLDIVKEVVELRAQVTAAKEWLEALDNHSGSVGDNERMQWKKAREAREAFRKLIEK